MISRQRKLFPIKGNYFLSKETIPSQRKWFSVKGNDFPPKAMISYQRKRFFRQGKQFPVKENDFLSKEIISFQSKWFPVKTNGFMFKEINSGRSPRKKIYLGKYWIFNICRTLSEIKIQTFSKALDRHRNCVMVKKFWISTMALGSDLKFKQKETFN